MARELEQELDRLYQVPLKEFTEARDELAKRLRSEGDGERADEVKKLRKPTTAVWLVNQLAREQELDVQRLLKAGQSLTKGPPKRSGRESSEKFLQARRDEHQALERLAKAARALALREGLGASSVTRATDTLRAAALSPQGRDLLKRGRLSEELQPPGFEVLTGLPGVAARPAQSKANGQTDTRRRRKEAQRHVQELRARERELSSAARSAEREAERAEAQASEARRRAEDAHDQAQAAAKERQAAEAELND